MPTSPVTMATIPQVQKITLDGLVEPMRRDLFLDWAEVLLKQNLNAKSASSTIPVTENSARNHNFQLPDDSNISISLPADGKTILLEASKAYIGKLIETCQQAKSYAEKGHAGNMVWWKFKGGSQTTLTARSMLHLMRNLGQHKRYHGTFTFGIDGFIKITQHGKESDFTFFPNQGFEVHFRSIGPGHGPFARKFGIKWAILIRGLFALASATPFEGPFTIFPVSPEEEQSNVDILSKNNTSQFHIDGIPVWDAVAGMHQEGAYEAFSRLFNSLQAFEQALLQQNDGAAIIFFVTAIEALATPNTKWAQERITKRFIEFLLLTCSDTLDEALAHANFESAFGKINGAKKLVERIYELRSARVHTGKFGETSGGIFGEDTSSQTRVMLVAEIARTAIIRFLFNPTSSLVGHPNMDPKITLHPSIDTYKEISNRSSAAGFAKSNEWILEEITKHLQNPRNT